MGQYRGPWEKRAGLMGRAGGGGGLRIDGKGGIGPRSPCGKPSSDGRSNRMARLKPERRIVDG